MCAANVEFYDMKDTNMSTCQVKQEEEKSWTEILSLFDKEWKLEVRMKTAGFRWNQDN